MSHSAYLLSLYKSAYDDTNLQLLIHNISMQIIHTFTVQSFSSSTETVTITYVDPDGEEHPVEAKIGKHLLDVAHDNNIELEGMYVEWT